VVHPFSCFFLEMMIPQANGLRNRWGRGENWPGEVPFLHCPEKICEFVVFK
jgi:hypothetical protein